MFTNKELVGFVENVYIFKWVYWYGTCGYECTETLYQNKKKQYPKYYTEAREKGYRSDISAGSTCADCVGMIKAFFWKGGDIHGINHYQSNNCPDVSANGMIELCKETGPISSMPDIPGLVVWRNGHIGVYIGNGYTIEERGFAYDCQKRKLSEGTWTKWGKLPSSMLEYETEDEEAPLEYELGERWLAKGDKGNDVAALQSALMILGYELPKYGTDGDFGSETEGAVRKFQNDQGLDCTGMFDASTYKALSSALRMDGDKPLEDEGDIPENGSDQAYVLIVNGDKEKLRLIQSAFGGTLAAVDSVIFTGSGEAQ